jgi:hypothetical protein
MPDVRKPVQSAGRFRAAMVKLPIYCSPLAIEQKLLQKHERLYRKFKFGMCPLFRDNVPDGQIFDLPAIVIFSILRDHVISISHHMSIECSFTVSSVGHAPLWNPALWL